MQVEDAVPLDGLEAAASLQPPLAVLGDMPRGRAGRGGAGARAARTGGARTARGAGARGGTSRWCTGTSWSRWRGAEDGWLQPVRGAGEPVSDSRLPLPTGTTVTVGIVRRRAPRAPGGAAGDRRGARRQRAGPSVLVTFEPHPLEVVNPQARAAAAHDRVERREVLAQRELDYVLVLRFDRQLAALTPEEFVRDVLLARCGMRELVIGHDHGFGRGRSGDVDDAAPARRGRGLRGGRGAAGGGDRRPARLQQRGSASAVAGGDLDGAARMLGRPYRRDGAGRRGGQAGDGSSASRPSTSPDVPPRKLLPPDGVYAVRVEWRGGQAGGMMNQGPRPTFGDEATDARSAPVRLRWRPLRRVGTIEWVARLRDIRAFASLGAAAAANWNGIAPRRSRRWTIRAGSPDACVTHAQLHEWTMFLTLRNRAHPRRRPRRRRHPCPHSPEADGARAGADGVMHDAPDHPRAAQARPRPPGRHAPGARARPVEAGLGRPEAGHRPRPHRAPEAHRRVRRRRAADPEGRATTGSWWSWPASPTRRGPRASCSGAPSSSSGSPTRPARSSRRCPAMDRHAPRAGGHSAPARRSARSALKRRAPQLLGGDSAKKRRRTPPPIPTPAAADPGRADPAGRGGTPPGEYLVAETAFPRVDSLLNLPEVRAAAAARGGARAGRPAPTSVGVRVRTGCLYALEDQPIVTGSNLVDAQRPARPAHQRSASSPSSSTARAAGSSATRPAATWATTWRSCSTAGCRAGRR